MSSCCNLYWSVSSSISEVASDYTSDETFTREPLPVSNWQSDGPLNPKFQFRESRSASIETKEIPSRTILQVNLADLNVFIEAWDKDDFEKQAFRDACGGLKEGDIVFLEAKDSHSDRRVIGKRRIAWLHLRESTKSGGSKLVLQMTLRKMT